MAQLNLQNKSYELDAANRIYVQENFQLLQSYKHILTNKFQGQFENIDFSNNKAAAQVKKNKKDTFCLPCIINYLEYQLLY